MHIKANEKINLKIQVGHIYMLKMLHSYHFSGSASVFTFLCVAVENGGGQFIREAAKHKRIPFAGGGLDINTINTPMPQKYQGW